MTQEQAKSDRKPRVRLSLDEKLGQLLVTKRAEVTKLKARAQKLYTEWQEADRVLVGAQAELERLEQTAGPSAREAAQ